MARVVAHGAFSATVNGGITATQAGEITARITDRILDLAPPRRRRPPPPPVCDPVGTGG